MDAVKEAIQKHGMFNIINYTSGFKADFMILTNQPFRKTEFSRRRKIEFYGMDMCVVTPEDLLLSKLIWIQDIQSALQMDDIRNLAALES